MSRRSVKSKVTESMLRVRAGLANPRGVSEQAGRGAMQDVDYQSYLRCQLQAIKLA